ncbi:unnamed protein product [Strongylus vulgaris]|uniref:dTMP kinase n=1 Tax=Strongylus vulgaris TaxID=40348 RepID=A0A3P7JAY7_STRVU|nr:unnamed protein product [Strongylus vulgaris]
MTRDRQEPFGQVIDRYLRKEIDLCERALHLAFSANRWEKAALIEEKIADGVNVICDRYCFSGVAYSIAKGEIWNTTFEYLCFIAIQIDFTD